MSSMPVSKYTRFSFAHPVLAAGLLLLAVPFGGFAQQRIIVNPTFVQRFQRHGGGALPDYTAVPLVPNSFCTPDGLSCFRYLGDAQCLDPAPGHTPVDDQGCMAGWITTDPYDGNTRFPDLQNGYIREPTQIGLGPNVEGLSVPNGAAELNAENAGRLYQEVCLSGEEEIPFRYSLGDPVSTGENFSQARFGIFRDTTSYPGEALSFVDSSIVSTQTMGPQSGIVTAPAVGGIYQIGFEAVNPPLGAVGNYIADVSITLKPLVDLSTAAVLVTEGQSGFLLVRVNGTVPAGGIFVSLQPGASTASPSNFTLGTPQAFGSSVVGSASLSSNDAGGYLLFIPQGGYDGNVLSDSRNETATNPSGSVRIPISTSADTIIEDNETYSLTIETPGTNGSSPTAQWGLGTTAAACWTDPSPQPSQTATVTIVVDDVDLSVTKLVDSTAPAVRGSVNYTVLFTNNTARPTVAPFTAHDATAAVADAVPPGLTFTSWTCAASGGASCPGGAVNGMTSGSGTIGGTAALPAGSGAAGGTVTFTINALVGAAQCSSVTNTAMISLQAPLQEATSADPGFPTPMPGGSSNNSASATITPICPSPVTVRIETATTNVSAIAGENVTLTFKVTNDGNSVSDGTQIDNPIPPGLSSFTWTCTAAEGAVCPHTSGSGPISETAGTFPAGGSLTYVVSAGGHLRAAGDHQHHHDHAADRWHLHRLVQRHDATAYLNRIDPGTRHNRPSYAGGLSRGRRAATAQAPIDQERNLDHQDAWSLARMNPPIQTSATPAAVAFAGGLLGSKGDAKSTCEEKRDEQP